jgi:hypothetical protein
MGSTIRDTMYPMYFHTINQVLSGLASAFVTISAMSENVPKV